MALSLYVYTYVISSEYGEWKSLISHFFQLVLVVTVFKGICYVFNLFDVLNIRDAI